MYIISEKLNSSSKSARAMLEAEDASPLAAFITSQKKFGAHACDINTALCSKSAECMRRACRMVLDAGMAVWIDSDDASLQMLMLEELGREAVINSVTSAPAYDRVITLAAECGAKVVAMPRGEASPVDEAMRLIEKLTISGIDEGNIFLDIMSGALAAADCAAQDAIRFLGEIKEKLPKISTVCGITNISYGLPDRDRLNAAFLTVLATHGLDAVICDIGKESIRDSIVLADLLCGRDELCAEYVTSFK